MRKRFFMATIALGMILMSTACKTDVATKKPMPETVTFQAADELTITADLYRIEDESAPYILLFHQTGSSRGEYTTIAPRLNEMGFHCLAVDQRAGDRKNEIVNETAAAAKDLGLSRGFTDAWPDMVAAHLYAKDVLNAEKIIVWGSSYSASLSLIMGSEFPESIAGILAFSPGEYFRFEENTVAHYVANIACPVLITSEAQAAYSEVGKALYDSIPVDDKVFFLPDGVWGAHGSGVLMDHYSQNELYWAQVGDFLNRVAVSSPAPEVALDLSASEITDLAQVDIPKNVTALSLNRNQISDLAPLKDLTNLRRLNLDGNRISDLDILKDLTNLTYLRLDSNQISDLGPLENLTHLTELHLYNNRISDLGPLRGLTNLTALYLDYNQISDIRPLGTLTQLNVLDLSGNQISDWSPVSHLPRVTGRPRMR